jgi:hypothetical protein
MVDWLAIGSACVMTALIGLGFVLWEHREDERLARERPRRRSGAARRRQGVAASSWGA